MPPNARRCNTCSTFQIGWRRMVPQTEVALALVLSIISVLAAVIPPVVRWWKDRSVTETRVFGVEDHTPENGGTAPMIKVGVTNSGTRPSFVRGATISFGKALGLGDQAVPLEIAEVRERYVRPDETSYLHLSSSQFVSRKIDPTSLNASNVTITLRVEEARRLGGRGIEERPDTVSAAAIERWLTYGAQ